MAHLDLNNMDVDAVTAVIRRAKELLADEEITDPLKRDDVADWANRLLGLDPEKDTAITPWQVRNLDTKGVVLPKTRRAGTRTFYDYSEEDLLHVIAVKLLETRRDVPYNKAVYRIGTWRVGSRQIPPAVEIYDRKADQSILTFGSTRTKRYIWTRCLKYALTLLFKKLPEDIYIIIDRRDRIEDKQRRDSSLTKLDLPPPEQKLFETSEDRIAAWINPSKMVYILPFLTIPNEGYLDHPQSFEIFNAVENVTYRLSLYLPFGSALDLTLAGREMLNSAGTYPGQVISNLLEIAFRDFRLLRERQDLTAVTKAVLQILPDFDHCGILLPKEGRYIHDRLTFRYYTNNFPSELKTTELISGDLVAGWVYKEGLPLFIEGIEPTDSRVSELENSFTAIAATPIQFQESWGVMYAARIREIEEGRTIITPIVQDFFLMLAGIAGEIGYNERLFRQNTASVLRKISRGPLEVFEAREVSERLTTEFAWVRDAPPNEYKGFNLSAMVIAIENIEEIENLCGSVVRNWLERQLLDLASEIMFTAEIKGQQDFYELHPGRYMFLLQRSLSSEDDIKSAARELKRIVNSIVLTTPDGPQKIDLLSWGIVYSYDRYLKRKLVTLKENQAPIRKPQELAKWLYDRFYGAAMALPHNEQGHAALARGDTASAYTHFADASEIDPGSPYYWKHKAEALLKRRELGRALDCCNEALGRDPDYSGGHYMKAEILTAAGESEKAAEEYELAIDISARAKHYSLYGNALMAFGKPDLAINQYRQAIKVDPQNRSVYDFLIYKALREEGDPIAARNKLMTIRTSDSIGLEILIQAEMKLIDAEEKNGTSSY